MGVAARVAGWRMKLGGQPGPFSAPAGSGDSPSGGRVEVELLIDGLWVDITSYVMTRDGSEQISITRGQPNEGNATEPGRCTFQLNNRDGRFSPRNTASPYYGRIGRNTQLRVSVPSGNDKSYRFWGEVASWPQRWDSTGVDVWVELEAAGILRRLGQGQTPLKSPMLREFSNPARSAIVAYWPCEDGNQATQVASGLAGGSPMAATGVDLAAYDDWASSDPLPTIGTGTLVGTVAAYPASAQIAARWFMRVAPSGVPGATPDVLSLLTSGSLARVVVYVDTSGNMGIKGYDTAGTAVFDSGLILFSVNGRELSIGVELTQSGADVTWRLFGFVVTTTLSAIGATGGTLLSHTLGSATGVRVGSGVDLGETAVGHVAVANDITAYASTGGALLAWAAEAATFRIDRLCREEQLTYVQVNDGIFGNLVQLGPQTKQTFLDLVTEAAFTDCSILIEPTDVLAVGRRSRLSQYNQSSRLALQYDVGHLSDVPVPVDDDQQTRNDITTTRPSGSSAQLAQETGPLSVLPPPLGVGRYDQTVSVSTYRDSDLLHQAGWRLHLGTVDEARFPRISVNLAHPAFANDPTLRQQALAVRPGDRITISNPPVWLGAESISQIVIGFAELIDGFQHRITYTCVPESPYQVAELGSAARGRLDTSGSVLVYDAPAGSTSLTVATTSGSVWTTAPGEVPLDVRIGGDRVSVSAVSGATSPQVFTVAALPHAQFAGAAVELYQPMTLGL